MPTSRKRTRSKKRTSSKRTSSTTPLIFESRNYVLLAIGVAMIALGFALMRLENEFLGTISLYVSPLLIMGGFAEIIYAILWRSDAAKERLQQAREAKIEADRRAAEEKESSVTVTTGTEA
jgi:sulfite exporter TauE/SafE